MFIVIGKRGIFSKEVLLEKLQEWGITNPQNAVKQAEEKRKYVCENDIRILLVGNAY